MARFTILLILTALLGYAAAQFRLAGQLFQLQGASAVDNAKLAWSLVDGADGYRVEKGTADGQNFQPVGTTTGNTHDVYGLQGATSFRITSMKGQTVSVQSNTITLSPYSPQNKYNTHDNVDGSPRILKSNLLANGVYYQYNYEYAKAGGFGRMVEQTSKDGYTFTGDKTVLTNDVLCKSTGGGNSCKLERTVWLPNPNTGTFVMWSHFEKKDGYGLGMVAVAHVTPGQNIVLDGVFRPGGDDSRDMTFFADGGKAWLITSANVNTNNNIYSLKNPGWTAIDTKVVQVNVKKHREAPNVIKSGPTYYLFSSYASGWLPSTPEFIAASNMAGPWGDATYIGNTATFCAQSGEVPRLASGQYVMYGDYWGSNWEKPSRKNHELMLPVSENPAGGFVSYHFYKTVHYSDDITTKGQGVYGVQTGRILSVNKPSSSSAGTLNIALANDGIQDIPGKNFKPSAVPFWYQIDLQDAHTITQLDLTTNLVGGSETYYQFTVSGSNDGKTFTQLADQTKNFDVGFVATWITSTVKYRYVRINVLRIINDINTHEADWASGIGEVTIYGN